MDELPAEGSALWCQMAVPPLIAGICYLFRAVVNAKDAHAADLRAIAVAAREIAAAADK